MKIPTLMTTRTGPVDNTAGYSQQRTSPAAFGAGIGSALGQLGVVLKQREEKTNRFGALTEFSNFESEITQAMMEGQRAAPVNGQGYAAATEADYDRRANEFINKRVPPELREEFQYRTAQLKQGVVSKALEFQYKAGDNYFRQGISTEYEKARTALDPRLGGDASQLEAYKTKMKETIDASDLSDIEKNTLWNNVQAGLEGVGYRAAVAGASKQEQAAFSGEIGSIIDDAAKRYGVSPEALRKVAWLESRGDPNAQNPDSSAGGLFQQLDSNAAAYGVVNKFDPRQSADGAARFMLANSKVLRSALGREPTAGELYLAHQQGSGGALKLLSNPNAKAVDVVGAKEVKLNGGNANMTAQEFANLWIRKAEGADAGAVDRNPAFANVPYEDRLALTKDAMRDATAEATEEAKQRKALYETQLNGLLTGIHDGTAGQVEIDAFRQKNPGMDYNDITKMDSALKTYNEGLGLAAGGFTKLEQGGVFDPTDTNDKKQVNAMVGKEGLAALAAGDMNVVANGIVPLVSRTGMIPTDVSGTLMGMMRSKNQQRALFAYDVMSQMSNASPEAFAQLPEATRRDVAFWQARKDMMQPDELFQALQGGATVEQRQATQTLRKEAIDYLGTKVNSIPNLKTLVANLPSEIASWYESNPSLPNLPWAAQAINQEYQTVFVDEYTRYGNVEDATAAAAKVMQSRWAVTNIGLKSLIRNPPESVYKAYNGSYDWIDQSIRADNKLEPDTQYQIIADDTTANEVELARNNQLFEKDGTTPRMPSYKIATYKDGVWREVDGRSWFKPDAETKLQDEIYFKEGNTMAKLKGRLSELSKVIMDAEQGFVQPDPDDVAEFEKLQGEYNALVEGKTQKMRDAPLAPHTDLETQSPRY